MAVIFSDQLVSDAQAGIAVPLTHARIMYDNVLRSATVSADSESLGFEVDATQSYDTYDRWSPESVPATATYTLAAASTVNYVFMASHNFGSTSTAFIFEYSTDGVAWTEFVPERMLANNAPVAILTENIQCSYIRIRVTSSLGMPRVGVVMSGESLDMQRAIYQGHNPVTLSRTTEIQSARSEGGRWLGMSKVRKGFATSYSWNNLTADWYRENFDPFVESAKVQPFGIAWRPETFPEEVVYAWTNGDIAPTNTGTRNLMSVDMSIIGYDAGDL